MSIIDHQTAKESARRARVDAIRDGAITREHLGQAATHRLLPDGRHEISVYDRAAGELRQFTGETLDQAIAAATATEGRR